jgi:hypothetical protein
MSNTTTVQSPWTGTNLYLQIILLIGSIWGGISQDTAGIIVAAGAGLVAAFAAIRTWVVNAKFTPGKSWIGDANNWSYIAAIVVALFPLGADLVPALKGLVDALVAQNWGQAITAGFSLISIVIYTFIKKK